MIFLSNISFYYMVIIGNCDIIYVGDVYESYYFSF